jgi:hypothetical protein
MCNLGNVNVCVCIPKLEEAICISVVFEIEAVINSLHTLFPVCLLEDLRINNAGRRT